MRYAICILLLAALCFAVGGCSGSVVYDDEFGESYIYKPESNMSYIRYLGPEETPAKPGENTLK